VGAAEDVARDVAGGVVGDVAGGIIGGVEKLLLDPSTLGMAGKSLGRKLDWCMCVVCVLTNSTQYWKY